MSPSCEQSALHEVQGLFSSRRPSGACLSSIPKHSNLTLLAVDCLDVSPTAQELRVTQDKHKSLSRKRAPSVRHSRSVWKYSRHSVTICKPPSNCKHMRPPDSTQLFTTTYEFNCADRPLFVALRCQLVPAHRLEPEHVSSLEHAAAFAVQVSGALSGRRCAFRPRRASCAVAGRVAVIKFARAIKLAAARRRFDGLAQPPRNAAFATHSESLCPAQLMTRNVKKPKSKHKQAMMPYCA